MQIMYRIIFDKHAVFALFSEMCWPAVWLHRNAADSREGGLSVSYKGRVPVDSVEHGYTVGGEVCCDKYGRNE